MFTDPEMLSRLRHRMMSGAAIQVVTARGVRAVYMTNNPDKLARWSVAEVE